MLTFLRSILPDMWVRLYPTDKEWDVALRDALARGAPVRIEGRHTALVGGVRVWIENWPYAFGRACTEVGGEVSGPPSRRTAIRLRRIIEDLRGQEMDRCDAKLHAARQDAIARLADPRP